MGSWNRSFDDKMKDLAEVIEEFLIASSESDVLRILEQHPELLSEEVDSMLDAFSKHVQSEEVINAIQSRRNFLALWREVCIDQAFKFVSSSSNEGPENDIKMILKEIDSLSMSQDTPRKITMLEYALSLAQRQSNPILWAALQMKLGNSLYQNSQGNRGNDIEMAIEHYNQAFEVYTYKDFPAGWAATQHNLALAYRDRICGDRAENIEKVIGHFNQALGVYTYKDFPVEWARTQYNLAPAYGSRIRGDRVENIEKSIEHYKQAIELYKYQDFPEEWAGIQHNLAATYCDRIRGDRAENIEMAIEHCNQALKVRTQKDSQVNWAATQNNLAIAYKERIRGDHAENMEKSIEYCNQALEVYTLQDFPVEWARTQNNLVNAYGGRIRGDRAENIEMAIEHCNQALEVYTLQDFPVDWATTQINVATAYRSRIREDHAENIEKAIEHCNESLKVYTKKDFPVEWAMTQNNLANAYCDRIRGDRAENIENAIEHYNQAFEVYTYKDFPVGWTATQHNLATAYCDRIRGDRAENIEKAIEHYNQALDVCTYHDFPVDWAETQHNLAIAYCNRIRGDRTENAEQAIGHYHSALQIYKLESMPNNFRRTCRLLGDIYLHTGKWKDATESYKNAIKAGNLLYCSGLSVESKAVEVKENTRIYINASLAACRIGSASEALLILERGKTRLLSEALRLKMEKPEGVPKDEWIYYERAAERYRTATKSSDCKENYAQREKEGQKALDELDAAVEVVQKYDTGFQKELDTSDILSILDRETALLAFCITNKGSIGFVVSESSGVKSVDIPGFKTEDLNNLLFKPDEKESIKGGWVSDYLSYLDALGTKNQEETFQSWQITFNNVLSSIGTKLLDPILKKLPPQTKRLIFLPSGGLFLLPLHATLLPDGQPLCQHYCVSYAPSIQLLREMKDKVGTIEGKGLYEVINPQEDPSLVFSGYEGQAISKLFQDPKINVGETGTIATILDRIPGKAYLHFSCHGSYNWNDPPQSGLYLVGGRTLSLADLQSDIVDMSSARLVTLSACETGITDIVKGSADEFVGLPAGFMLAGVPCVVSSLWSVPDISTALLMERFYSNHIGGMDIPLALQDAQLWVRNLTSMEVVDYVEKCYISGTWESKSKEFIEQYRGHYLKMAEESPDEKPFYHPYYWAAFTVNGA